MNVNTRYTSPPYPPHSTQPFPILSFQPLVSFFLPPPSSYHSHSTIFSFFMFITPPFLFILLLLTIFLPSHPPCSHPPRPNTYPPPLSHTNSLNLLTYPLSTPSNFFLPLHFFTNVPSPFSHTFHLILPPFHTTY